MEPRSAARRLILARWLILTFLLIAEIIGLTVRFDAGTLQTTGGWSAALFSQAKLVPEFLIAVTTAFLVVCAGRLRSIADRLCADASTHIGWPLFLACQLAAYAGLWLFTARIFEEGLLRRAEGPALWTAGWCALAAATLGFWVISFAPVRAWSALVRRELPWLAVASCVGFSAWSAGRATRTLWRPWGDATIVVVEGLLRLFERNVFSRPAEKLLGTRTFPVSVSPACSGYEGIGLVAVFLATFLWTSRTKLRFPQALLLLPLGVAGIWLANTLRMTGLILVGTRWSRELAVGGFHSQTGWLAFNLLALGLVFAVLRFPWFSRTDQTCHVPDRNRETAAHLVPLVAFLAAGLTSNAFPESGFDHVYPFRVLAALAALWCFRHKYRELDWKWSWWAVGVGVVVFLLSMGLDLVDKGAHPTTLAGKLSIWPAGWRITWLAVRVAGAVIVVPFVEELAFRGYLMRLIGGVEFDEQGYARCSWWAVITTSILFGLLHGRWLADTLAGLAYALVVRRRGKLCDAIVAHAVTNLLTAETVLIAGFWWLWK
jgi:exosortase E/protease (VPEID-CTERM system)